MRVEVVRRTDVRAMALVDALLARAGLTRDADVTVFAVAHDDDGRPLGCLGLCRDIVTCAAVAPDAGVLGALLTTLRHEAHAAGYPRLFCDTTPAYRPQFVALGFHAIAEVPGLAVLLEDDPHGIERYRATLAASRREGRRVAGVVVNANPFTLGHEHLIRCAAAACDVVHVFVVGDDLGDRPGDFSYAERFDLVNAGVALMPERDRVVVHPGSRYIVSRATFPRYFRRGAAVVDRAHAGIDLQLFRVYIAPALGITDRFVGDEPTNPITARYNADMPSWLERADLAAPRVRVTVVPRLGHPPVSASRVRALIANRDLAGVRRLVPKSTYDLIERQMEGGRGCAS